MKQRNLVIDAIRGVNLLSMILFHAIWDLVYIFNVDMRWYRSNLGNVWQILIACTFVILSGYCSNISRNKLKNGLKVFMAGAVVSIVTQIFMSENRILFGVLTMLGSCMLIMIPLERILRRTIPLVGFIVSGILFIMFYQVSCGYIGIDRIATIDVPDVLYSNLFTTYMGFPTRDFYSSDYFGILPWLFLFICGYYIYRLIHIENTEQNNQTSIQKNANNILNKCNKVLEKRNVFTWLGRHSLVIYMIHQPVVYALFFLIFLLIGEIL